MIQTNTLHRVGLIAFLLLMFVGVASAQSASKPKTKVLSRIEKYKAPRYPKSQYLDRETYDYRIKNGNPVPKTLTDVFICDVWQRVTMDLKLEIEPEEVYDEVIEQALNVYLDREWENIAGYRPWTHWNFVRKLKDEERGILVKEIVEYIQENGVRDVDG